ncbi:uncharacterized protein A4U43_C05F6210 [Asparagus officinalis]|uniref:DUF632 domain-containing protein n=1 Tax=Asparagus officinalis TaxID=4686 RepID=A0A5P1EQ03_ASPOF|nr:uncharacterized protein A4U43_C05F6210 [Asparagus officinalis]
MGCAQSRIENEESVSRCKDRKQFMRDAVTARNAFAAAHSSYTMALKNSGAALSDFGHGESHHPSSSIGEEIEEPVTPEKGVMDPPLPPPPPPETPPMMTPPEGLPPRPEKKTVVNVHHQHAASEGAVEMKKGKMVDRTGVMEKMSVSLLQVLMDLDDHFLKASEGAHEVSKMLEANRMHYHSNFADNRGHIDHSARVMRVITWNRSFKGMLNTIDGRDDFDNDEWETHATVLDKMLAWEKKLYEEVKAGELMKIEYQRKVALLNKQKRRGANAESIEKTKAAVSHLHTRYIVDMQSMDSTVHEIQRLRDDQLYPKLVELVDGYPVRAWTESLVGSASREKLGQRELGQGCWLRKSVTELLAGGERGRKKLWWGRGVLGQEGNEYYTTASPNCFWNRWSRRWQADL